MQLTYKVALLDVFCHIICFVVESNNNEVPFGKNSRSSLSQRYTVHSTHTRIFQLSDQKR